MQWGLFGERGQIDGGPTPGVGVGMELVVDLSSGTVALRDEDEMSRFSLRALRKEASGGGGKGAPGALAAALSAHDAGAVEPDGGAVIPPAVVRRLASEAAAKGGRSLDDAWEAGFASMLEYAATAGWITDDGSIRVHVEWKD
jgi:hypothetical protein